MQIQQNQIKLIVGLGNPETKYSNTRHNIGFAFIDYLVSYLTSAGYLFTISNKKEYIQMTCKELGLVCQKPLTYMNTSGIAINQVLKSTNNLTDSNVIVVFDDLDIPLGKYKITYKSPKKHNGILSINKYLKPEKYLKLRIGIENRVGEEKYFEGMKYVLAKFNHDELIQLQEVFKQIVQSNFLSFKIGII